MPIWITLLAAVFLVTVHLFGFQLRKLQSSHQRGWLSLGGGISVSYIFVHLLPELHEGELHLAEDGHVLIPGVEFPLFLIALLGLLLFYGIERHARLSRKARRETFWTHLTAFAIYNLLVGELLTHLFEEDLAGLLFYCIAMAAHFLVNDLAMIRDYKELYLKKGRWILAAAPLLGWAAGIWLEIPHRWWLVIFSLVAGGTILNVLKEELPEEQNSNFKAFAGGALLYTALLILLL